MVSSSAWLRSIKCRRGLLCGLRGGRDLVTFDDGYDGVHRHTLPILKQYGLRGMLFVATGGVDGQAPQEAAFAMSAPSRWLTWDQVKALRLGGMEIGSHSVTHRNLALLDEAAGAYNWVDTLLRVMVR